MKIPAYDWPRGPTRWIEGRTLFVSVPFTWNLEGLREEFMQGDFMYEQIVVGGPAVRLMAHALNGLPDNVTVTWQDHPGALARVNPLATVTSRGCCNACDFCAVPRTEGDLVELSEWSDRPVICDNNLLACSDRHFDRVMDRVEKHGWCDFNQGLDCRLLDEHHAERIGRVKGAIVRLALDSAHTISSWLRAFNLLVDHGTSKRRVRSYVLCAHTTGIDDAWARCELIEDLGAMPLPQWFHELDALKENVVTKKQKALGWNDKERKRIMRHFYMHTDGNGSHH